MKRFYLKILALVISACFLNLKSIQAQITADFSATQTSVCPSVGVGLTATISSPNPIDTIKWDLGNGVFILDDELIGFQTSAPGDYTIRLVVIDNMGLTDTITKVDYIAVTENPDVDFSIDATSGCAPLDVVFTYNTTQMTGSGWTWTWIFVRDSTCVVPSGQDTVIVSNPNPFTHTFTEAGVYDVHLIVENSLNCIADTTKLDLITVFPSPIASFTPALANDCDTTTLVAVTFTNTSDVPCATAPTYQWHFGDGMAMMNDNPMFTYDYAMTGDMAVKLIVNDGTNNCIDSIEQIVTIVPNDTAGFSYTPLGGCTGDVIQFTDLSTGNITEWLWDFGDGNTSTEQNPTHVYATTDCYTVTLTTTIGVCSYTATSDTCIFISGKPVISYSSSDSLITCASPYDITFNSTIAGTLTPLILWEFGDGDTSTLTNPTHTYTTAGNYPVTLTVTTPQGCVSSITSDTVRVDSFVVHFSSSGSGGCDSLTVQFMDSSFSHSAITSWFWEFGDGITSTEQNPAHKYTSGGSYNVKLVVMNAAGCLDSVVLVDYVRIGSRPIIDFSVTDSVVCLGDTIQFINNSPDTANITWSWNFSGLPLTGAEPSIAIALPGSFTISVIANQNGCQETLTKPNYISVVGPGADFTTDADCDPPMEIPFVNNSTNGVAYHWDFGIDNITTDTSSAFNPSYTFPSPDQYTITLVVTDINGCIDSSIQEVNIDMPQSKFGWFPDTTDCIPAENLIQLLDSSDNFITCEWIIPNGTFEFGASPTSCFPVITFDSAGYHEITHVVEGENGCTDTLTQTICITDVFPEPFVADINDPDEDTSTFVFTDSLGNMVTGCLMQIDSVTGDTTILTSVGTTALDCANGTFEFYTGCVPLTINFRDTAYAFPDSVVAWHWDFGDGNSSTEQNPTHTYTTASGANGYAVVLTVKNTYGAERSDTLDQYIRPTQPNVSFTPQYDTACTNQAILFTNHASGIALNYSWDFGNGDTHTSRSPTYAYATEGTYQVCVTVTDANNCDSTFCRNIVVLNPLAGFMADTTYSACENLAVQFTDTSLNAISWEWSFGNGDTSNLQNPSTNYVNTGFYTVRLIITSVSGCQDTLERTDFVQVDGPLLTDMSALPTDSCVDQTVTFNVQGYNISLIRVDYGNGQDSIILLTNTSDIIDTSIIYTYTVGGVYHPTLRVEDSLRCAREFPYNTISVTEPIASFTLDTTSGCVPFNINANGTASNNAVQYEWYASGNNVTISGQGTPTPTIHYTDAGFYDSIQLVVTDIHGCEDTMTHVDPITASNVFPAFTPDVTTGCLPLLVNFTDSSTAFPDNIVSWNWDFGDNTAIDTVQNATHTFVGTPNIDYNITLTVANTLGCQQSISQQIRPTLPIPDFRASAVACTEQTVAFNNLSTGIGLNYHWNFGDSTFSTEENTSHFYAREDTFIVILTATDTNNCVATDSIYRIVVADPLANFTADKTFIACPADTVNFINLSANAVAWEWSFEGTSPDTAQTSDPSRVFTDPGLYDVSLIITSASGCMDTIVRPDYILVEGPFGILDFAPRSGCQPLPVDFQIVLENTVNVIIDKGDGSALEFIPNPPDTLRYSYTYTTRGIFTPRFLIQDATGCQRQVTNGTIHVTDPQAIYTLQPDSACVPFDATVINNSIDANSFAWSSTGGTIDNPTAPIPTFSFTDTDTGTYQISLAIEDIYGCVDTNTQTISAGTINVLAMAGPMGGCGPLSVQFTDQSSAVPIGSITEWVWDFGNGDSAFIQNPQYTYIGTGNYTATLSVTNTIGCTDTYVLPNQIAVTQPTVSYVASTDFVCPGQEISFTSTATGENITYTWDFGNGDGATATDTTYTYITEGVYNVCLTITDINGCDTVFCRPITVANPVANFVADTTYASCPPATIQFTDASVYATSWQWDFGDGTTSTTQNPSHTYTQTGFYTVCLVVTSPSGCVDTLCRNQYIQIGGPVGNFDSQPQMGCAPLEVTFTANGTDIATYTWRFGNGDSLVHANTSGNDIARYTYTSSGVFYPELFLESAEGCPVTMLLDSIVVDTIQLNFTASDTLHCEMESVNFTSSITSSAAVESIEWLFEGGTPATSNSPAPSVAYNTLGLFDVSLIVNSGLCIDTLTKADYIEIAPNPVTSFTYTPDSACVPSAVNFTDATTIASGNIVNWNWMFGDGSTNAIPQPTHTYLAVGTYDVQLLTISDRGCTDTLLQPQIITINPLPVSLFTADTLVCTGQTVNLVNTSTGFNLGHHWTFGDGVTSTAFEPVHTYAAEGVFTICLTVTDGNTCDSTICRTITVADPVAQFTQDTTYLSCPPDSVQFTDQSTNAVAWAWTFGDGTSSTLQHPNHTYTTTGLYDVCLIVTSASGCQDTICKTQLIQVDGPTGSFALSPNTGCTPATITFVANTTNTVRYDWSLGDGNNQTNMNNTGMDSIDYTYTIAGNYLPSVTITDGNNCPLTLTASDSILIDTLQIDFAANDTLACEMGTFSFSTLIGSNTLIDSIRWIFEGATPSTSTDLTPTISYDSLGIFDVTLMVYNRFCSKTITKADYIRIAPNPSVGFGTLMPLLCSETPVDFVNTTTIASGSVAAWDWEFGNGDSSHQQSPSYTFGSTGNFDINLFATSDFGCTDDTTIALTLLLSPTANAGLDTAICNGNEIPLMATGGISYAWAADTTLSCLDCAMPMASPTVSTTYSVTATAANGCTNTDDVVVAVLPYAVPPLTVSPDTTICVGETIQLFAGGSNNVLDFIWDESREGLSCYLNCFNPFASPITTTTYVVTLISPGGCQATDSITVTVLDDSTPILGADRTICAGDSIQLQTTLGANATWQPSSGLNCVFCPAPYAFPRETTTYTVEVTTGNNCFITDTMTVFVLDKTDIDAGNDGQTCLGASIQLSGVGMGAINWLHDGTLSDSAILNPIVTPNATTNYILTTTNGECTLRDTITIIVGDGVDIELLPDTICQGEVASLIVEGFAETLTWLPESSIVNTNPTIANPMETTTYTVIGGIEGCVSDTASNTVVVHPSPDMELLPLQTVFTNTPTPLSIQNPNPNYTYTWTPDNLLTCGDCPAPFILVDSAAINNFTIFGIAMTPEGCIETGTVDVEVNNRCSADIIQMPTAFTPNGDGQNDVLYVRGNGIQSIEVFRVFDRWGQLVFETKDINSGWDGRYKGQFVNQGVYVYYILTTCPSTEEEVIKKGDIMLKY